MSIEGCSRRRGPGSRSTTGWIKLSLAFSLWAGPALADGPNVPKTPAAGRTEKPKRLASPKDDSLNTAALLEALPTRPASTAEEKSVGQAPVAAARFEGMATVGGQIRLVAEGSTGQALRYRWHQTSGPTAELIDPDRAMARVKIPEGASNLGFLLIVSNAQGMDSIPLSIPVEDAPAVPLDDEPKANAGDDQVGFVGRQITLNGIRSEPRAKVGYRWIQVGGPKVKLKIVRGHYFSFVPSEPGEHRFALVVAAGSVISEPDEVVVSIDYPPSKSPRVESVPRPSIAPEPSELLLSGFVESSIKGLDGGPAAAGSLSQTFDSVASRMGLFRCYDETFSEISRRLDGVIPQDPGARDRWIERFFGPITTKLIEEARKEGLDLSTAPGRAASLSDAQKARMAEVFRAIAEGSRGASRTP